LSFRFIAIKESLLIFPHQRNLFPCVTPSHLTQSKLSLEGVSPDFSGLLSRALASPINSSPAQKAKKTNQKTEKEKTGNRAW
jgi:hypothetical protein